MRGWLPTRPTPAAARRGVGAPRLVAALAVALLVGAALAGCSSKSSSARPDSPAQIHITSPTAGQIVPSTFTVQVDVTSATVAPASQAGTAISPTKGFLHVSIDGRLVGISYTTTPQIPNLAKGTHQLLVQFVATDHLPFANHPQATVSFQVG